MSSWHADQLKYAFGLGGLLSFYGIVTILAWFLSDRYGLSNAYTIVIIALVLLTLPFALIIGFVATRRSKKREAAEAEPQSQAGEAAPADAGRKSYTAPAGSYAELTAGAEEVVQFLKSSNLGKGSKEAVYSLPWFLVAGAPRSGKSSLVIGSNLNVQTLPSQRQSEQKFVRPTPAVDWRVTSDAVFVDTAGRFQTEGVDADEWSALLETIRKHRPNTPIDGFVLVVDSEKILASGEREIEEQAKVLRSRLDEAIQRLKTKFPVYLVFSHADAIEGFRDSFSTSKGEDKSLVWGSTVPLEKSENAQALFDSEFETLHASVMKRRLLRLSAPFPPIRQLRIFNFPLHFGAARRKFGAFVNTLFRPNPFSENPFLRGFYFVAAPASQGGAVKTVGSTHFVERLFRDVLLRDKDLARTFAAHKQRPPIMGWSVTMIGAFLTLLLLGLSAVSLYYNRQLLADSQTRGEKMIEITRTDAYKDPAKQNEQDVRREMAATEELRQLLVKLDDYERDGPPLHLRFGLYSGNRVFEESLLPLYMSVVEHRFKSATIARVEAELRKFAAGKGVTNPAALTEAEEQTLDKNYDLLKAYLMLSGEYKNRAEARHIADTLDEYWVAEAKLPADLTETARAQLEFWAKQVDRDTDVYRFPRIGVDSKLVTDARQKLQAFPAINRYYKRRTTEISKQVDEEVGTFSASAMLTRNNADTGYLNGSYTVRGAYTKPGYELMKTAIAEANEKLSEGDWVMGETGRTGGSGVSDSGKMQEMYDRDYALEWRNFVKGIDVVGYNNRRDAAEALQAFASPKSPMKILLQEVARNTNLSAPTEEGGLIEWLKSWFVSESSDENEGTSLVEKEFRPLFTFVGKKNETENAPVDRYANEINAVYKLVSGMDEGQFREIPKKIADEKDPLKLADRDGRIADLTQSFNETPGSQEIASLLKEPIERLRELLGVGEKELIVKSWNEQILPAAKEIERGYPFEDGEAESDLTKLSAYLNPVDGKLSRFYDERLKKYFEESNGQLKVKDTSKMQFTPEFVAYLNNAFNLRKILFGTSQTPKFEYEFRLNPVRDAIVELSIDGQPIRSDGTGSIRGTFPAASASETGVLINLVSSTGTVSTAPSANSGNSNVSVTSGQPPSTGSSGTSQQRFAGNWGLFRFVDAGRPQKQPGGDYQLTYSLGGKAVTANVRPSGGDLFDKNVFRQVKAPQNAVQ